MDPDDTNEGWGVRREEVAKNTAEHEAEKHSGDKCDDAYKTAARNRHRAAEVMEWRGHRGGRRAES